MSITYKVGVVNTLDLFLTNEMLGSYIPDHGPSSRPGRDTDSSCAR